MFINRRKRRAVPHRVASQGNATYCEPGFFRGSQFLKSRNFKIDHPFKSEICLEFIIALPVSSGVKTITSYVMLVHEFICRI